MATLALLGTAGLLASPTRAADVAGTPAARPPAAANDRLSDGARRTDPVGPSPSTAVPAPPSEVPSRPAAAPPGRATPPSGPATLPSGPARGPAVTSDGAGVRPTAPAPRAPTVPDLAAPSVRIMPLGDSITRGAGSTGRSGYRHALWQRLTAHPYPAVDFVGSRRSGALPDPDNEGHSGWRIDQITDHVTQWVTAAQPDVVLLHIGTNDMKRNVDVDRAPRRLGRLLDRIHAARPDTLVVVAKLVPAADPEVDDRIDAFNARLPEVVHRRAAAGRPVRLVDLDAGMGRADTTDGLHPNDAGYAKMADRWYTALVDVLDRAATVR